MPQRAHLRGHTQHQVALSEALTSNRGHQAEETSHWVNRPSILHPYSLHIVLLLTRALWAKVKSRIPLSPMYLDRDAKTIYLSLHSSILDLRSNVLYEATVQNVNFRLSVFSNISVLLFRNESTLCTIYSPPHLKVSYLEENNL